MQDKSCVLIKTLPLLFTVTTTCLHKSKHIKLEFFFKVFRITKPQKLLYIYIQHIIHQFTFPKAEAVGYWEGFEVHFTWHTPHSCWIRCFHEKHNTSYAQKLKISSSHRLTRCCRKLQVSSLLNTVFSSSIQFTLLLLNCLSRMTTTVSS